MAYTLTGPLPATDLTLPAGLGFDTTTRRLRETPERATDAVDVIGDRFGRQPTATQATVGGQAVDLDRDPQRGRWRHTAGVAYGVARALGVEVGSSLAGGDG